MQVNLTDTPTAVTVHAALARSEPGRFLAPLAAHTDPGPCSVQTESAGLGGARDSAFLTECPVTATLLGHPSIWPPADSLLLSVGSFQSRKGDIPESPVQMRHRPRGERVHEDARDALEVGHAAQADAQTHAGLWGRTVRLTGWPRSLLVSQVPTVTGQMPSPSQWH